MYETAARIAIGLGLTAATAAAAAIGWRAGNDGYDIAKEQALATKRALELKYHEYKRQQLIAESEMAAKKAAMHGKSIDVQVSPS